MKSAIFHNVSRFVSHACLERRQKMRTTPCNSNDEDVSPAEVSRRQNLTNAESGARNFVASQLLSRSSLRSGRYTCGHSGSSDDDLITAAQRGDQQAFVELCGRHSSVVKHKILRIVRNREDAEDALQDTLLRAYTHMPTFRRSCKFSTWLVTIGVNSALMIMRKRKTRKETYESPSSLNTQTPGPQEPVDRSLGPEEIYLKKQAVLLLRREVEKLHPTLRSVVDHYYRSDCQLDEAAKAQEISLAAAKSRLQRGRIRLRSSLVRYGISNSCS
jgi:RNA polymerase sigma-70 factor (ECF subfamily)